MNFKSLPQMLDYFRDEKTCIEYYEKMRWNGNPVCPHCKAEKPYKTNCGYKCSNSDCYKKFTVKVGTIFQNSKLPFRMWFIALFLTTHKKGISSVQLSIDIGVTQPTAWFMLHRIRKMYKAKTSEIIGKTNPVEIDETHIGGKEKNRHWNKKRRGKTDLANDGTPYNKKKVVVGFIERNGRVILKYTPDPKAQNILPLIKENVKRGCRIVTDESVLYVKLKKEYKHDKVNHSFNIYTVGDSWTNSIENFWSILKRGINGTYHTVSSKYLDAYLDEFSTRFNNRHINCFENFKQLLYNTEGTLTYKNLVSKE